MKHLGSNTDGVMVGHWYEKDSHLLRQLSQPNRLQILKENAELRKHPEKFPSFDFGKVEHRFPEIDLYLLKQKYPELRSSDPLERELKWKELRASSELDLYRTSERGKIIPTG